MLVLVVDAGQALAVKHAVVAAVMDPGTVLHTLKTENMKLNLYQFLLYVFRLYASL